jgi:hypothetical protein
VVRWGAGLLAAVAVAVLWGSPAQAHGAVTMTVHSDGRGSVWLTAIWADNHSITDPIGAILTGTSATGAQVGPAPLKQNGDALTYTGELSPGDWTVTAEMGTPAVGRCEATIHVVAAADPSPSPTAVTCASSPPAPVAAPSTSDPSFPVYRLLLPAAALVLLVAAAAAWLKRRSRTVSDRRSPTSRTPARTAGKSPTIPARSTKTANRAASTTTGNRHP